MPFEASPPAAAVAPLVPAAVPSPAAPADASQPRAHPLEREVPVPPAFLADAAREPAYDIEREMAEPERSTLEKPRPIHTFEGTRVRRPVSAMRRDNDVLVICDDGTVWSKRPTGWVQEAGIPGTEHDVSRRMEDSGGARS